jgi:hypothetical protein
MRRPTKSRRVSQLPLFSPPMTTPRWESLPRDVRRQVLVLLVRWLRGVAEGGTQAASQEAADE